MAILIFGGTADAVVATDMVLHALDTHGVSLSCTYSLAGVTPNPRLPTHTKCHIRTGGFGGYMGIIDYILTHDIDTIFDITHPYATQISANIQQALCELSLNGYAPPLYRYMRPWWAMQTGMYGCNTVAELANATKNIQGDILLALGNKDAPKFFTHQGRLVIRSIAPVSAPNGIWIGGHMPKNQAEESTLFDAYAFQAVICKNSGTDVGYYKIACALQRNIPIYVLNRPMQNMPYIYDNTVMAHSIHTLVQAFIKPLHFGV